MDTSQQSESPTQTQNPFEELDQYPWDSDAEFQTGLSSILASNQSPELADDLTLRARCFYYARKTGTTVDFEEYKSWRRQRTSASAANESANAGASQTPLVNGNRLKQSSEVEQKPVAAEADPPRLSYQEVVELIQSGKPVPGIKEIPNTILEGQGTSSLRPGRKKPWEKDPAESRQPLEVQLENTNE